MSTPETPSARLDDQLLRAFMEGFFGYGDPKAAIWFVGMEEGGGTDIQEVSTRLRVWDEGGRKRLEDVVQYHSKIGVFDNFRTNPPPKIQSTWRGLIHIAMWQQGLVPDKESVRSYQRSRWARAEGDTCSLELFPLPKRSLVTWDYNKWSTLSELGSPSQYYSTLLEPRLRALASLIATHEPRWVIFYGTKYRRHWERLAGGALFATGELPVKAAARFTHPTSFIAIPHTTAHGLTHEFFAGIGKYLAVEGAIEHA